MTLRLVTTKNTTYQRDPDRCVCKHWYDDQKLAVLHHPGCRWRNQRDVVGLTPEEAYNLKGPPSQ